jgi:hypothetical protein
MGRAVGADRMIPINRTVIVVRTGQPILDWRHRVGPTSTGSSLEDPRREPTIYMLPECENEGDSREYLGWFEWSLRSMVVARRDDPLFQEEI